MDKWHNNGPQHLVTLSPCIQNAINEMHLSVCWSAVVRPVGCTAKFSETPLETAYGREINIQFTGNSSRGHSCSQHANCMPPQNVLCDKTAHFKVAFYCGQPKAHLCNNYAV